ncbi:hypothetical protein [Streptomyces lushanensis]|uniref:hypothetical protein n=1 Tax=Streptomyces lushanensis TaxID=1434255 RepID=UPI000B05C272|nr:hypothetical protein [Streptomyces lushanensis]
MTTTSAGPDPTMEAIGRAVIDGRAGDIASARQKLLSLWSEIGVTGDPLHRCSLAHYLADLYEDPAQALAWDIRAMDAAEAVTEQRVREHHADLHIAGFYPSLHLNLADNYRRLGSFEAATKHIDAAKAHVSSLPQDSYGDLIRGAVQEVAEAIAVQDRTQRASALGSTA